MSQENILTLSQRLKGLMLFRVLLVTLVLGGAIFTNAKVLSDLSTPRNSLHFGLIIATYVATILYALTLRRRGASRALAHVQLGVDLVMSGVLVITTGGLHTSIFLFTLFLPIIAGALLTGRRTALICAGVVSIYILYLALLSLGHVPGPPKLAEEISMSKRRDVLTEASVNIVFAFLLAWSSGQLAKQLGEAKSEIERRQVDLRELRALNENILSSLNSGLLTMDLEGRIIFFNQAAEQITGRDAEEVFGTRLREVFPKLAAHLRQEPGGAGQEARLESPYEHPGGKTLYLGFSTSVLRDGQGERNGSIVIFQDLTQVKRLEQHAKRSERMAAIGQLAASIAHEIRNPLASISGSVEMLQSLSALSEDEEALMAIVLREVDRLNELITEFLEYSRPRPIERTPTDLAHLIEESLRLFRHRARETEVTLLIEESARQLRPQLDAEAFRQVIWNLLNNAADALGVPTRTGEFQALSEADREAALEEPVPEPLEEGVAPGSQGPRIDLELRHVPERGRLMLAIEDNGSGVDPAIADRIFEPFYTTRKTGTGLGLATIHRLIEDHDGSILLTTPERLDGARFEIWLQLGPEDREAS